MVFEDWLKSLLRSRSDLNQRKLAKLIGVTETTVSKWVHGETQPRHENIWKLSEVSGVPIRQMYEILGKQLPDHLNTSIEMATPDDVIIPPELIPFFKPIIDGLARLRDTPTFEYAVRGVTAMLETMIEQIEEEKKRTKK